MSPFQAAIQQQRGIHIDTQGEEGTELSEKDYHRLADLTLGEVMAKLETLIEETSGIADSDLEYSQARSRPISSVSTSFDRPVCHGA